MEVCFCYLIVLTHDLHKIIMWYNFGHPGSVQRVESCKIVLRELHFLFTCSDTCCQMFRLAKMHSVTDERRDRPQI